MLKLVNFHGPQRTPCSTLPARNRFSGPGAGAILLAKEVRNPAQESFGVIDLTCRGVTAYGRQTDSWCWPRSIPTAEFQQRAGRLAMWKRCLSARRLFAGLAPP